MAVTRIVANIAAQDISLAKHFYEDVLGLRVAMDHGFTLTFAAEGREPSDQRRGGRCVRRPSSGPLRATRPWCGATSSN